MKLKEMKKWKHKINCIQNFVNLILKNKKIYKDLVYKSECIKQEQLSLQLVYNIETNMHEIVPKSKINKLNYLIK